MFSSRHFIVSGLTFRPLIHFEFIFVYGVRKCSNFILLHVAVQFSQHHLLKSLSLPHCIFLPPLSKIKVPIGAWVCFWAFCLIPLACVDLCKFSIGSHLPSKGSRDLGTSPKLSYPVVKRKRVLQAVPSPLRTTLSTSDICSHVLL